MTDINSMINFGVDLTPFLIYSAVLWKVWSSWRLVKRGADLARRHRMAAVLGLLGLVVACFLAANAYALAFYGKTYLSIRMFQLFLAGNCAVYWLVLDILTKDSVPEQGQPRESAG